MHCVAPPRKNPGSSMLQINLLKRNQNQYKKKVNKLTNK